MIRRNMVKSKASSVHPSHAATQASHWSLVGSFHHGTDDLEASAAADGLEASAAVVTAFPPRRLRVRHFGEAPADGMLAVRHPARISTKSSSAALPQNLPRMITGYNARLSHAAAASAATSTRLR